MTIIRIQAEESGGRPGLQQWNAAEAPEGYALCPEEFHSVFYSTSPAGFVNITVEDGTVTEMVVNREALSAYVAEHPESEPTEPEATADEVLDALLGVTE